MIDRILSELFVGFIFGGIMLGSAFLLVIAVEIIARKLGKRNDA